MARRTAICQKLHCGQPVSTGGLCEQHHEEALQRRLRRDEALNALNTGQVDGRYLVEGPLVDEWRELREWWDQICHAVNNERQHPVLKDETEYGVSWCIAIAQELIDAQQAYWAGREDDASVREYRRQEIWSRFRNMERGLMSNGIARPVQK